MKKDPNPKTQDIQDIKRRPNLWIIGIGEKKDLHLKWPVNIFNKLKKKNKNSLKNYRKTHPNRWRK
jgi:hypothetical protein